MPAHKYLNPLTVLIFLACLSISLFLFGSSDQDLIGKMLFAPYLLDISRGVGDTAATYFRWTSAITFVTTMVFVVLRARSNVRRTQRLATTAGMVASILHFGIVSLGYVTTRLH